MHIREESEEDYIAVEELVKMAFLSAEHSDNDEHNLVARLRKGENYIPELSLVAEDSGKLKGHILLSKIIIKGDSKSFDSLALAPISVLPEYQKQGVGKALMKEAINRAEKLGYTSIIVLGYPLYYNKFGFKRAKDFGITVDIPDVEDYLMVLKLGKTSESATGKVVYGSEFMIKGN